MALFRSLMQSKVLTLTPQMSSPERPLSTRNAFEVVSGHGTFAKTRRGGNCPGALGVWPGPARGPFGLTICQGGLVSQRTHTSLSATSGHLDKTCEPPRTGLEKAE